MDTERHRAEPPLAIPAADWATLRESHHQDTCHETGRRRPATARNTAHPPSPPCFTYRNSIGSHRNSMGGWAMGKLTVFALRAVLVVVLAGTVFVQAGMVWA